jgi:lon-related putative ATP-dependent protease
MGMGFAPMKGDEVVSPEVFNKLPASEREKVANLISALQDELQAVMRELPRLLQAAREKVKALNEEVTTFAVGHLIDSLRAKYGDIAEIVRHLNRVQDDVIENAALFRDGMDGGGPGPMPGGAPAGIQAALEASLRRYQANLLVDHSDNHGAPVVHEPDPSYQNLVGRVEHLSEMGALVTDFNLIKPGALHLANGGYLILDARKVLTRPYAWEGLKEAVRAGEIRIESLGQMFSLVSTVSLEPEKIPVRVKVVMLGDPMLYYLLQHYDPEFAELFKVPVDFDDRMARDASSSLVYARFIATQARTARLKPLDPQGVALVVEESARLAGDSERLSTLTREISDILAEADYRASERRSKIIGDRDIRTAIEARQRRSDRIAVRMREEVERGTILIETEGAHPGQINGLSVIQLGGFSFGRPARITARVRMGRGQVIDIEREVKLGGATHSKGVLILSNFLAARFSADTPLSLAASLAFEQSYGGIDGDSASSTELYAILSALADAPIDQGLAVTGSVNQFGEVQAIGGVNQKIEGFYDLCLARGLTRRQGVLIPKSNMKHLMLREDIVEAAEKGRFHVYPVETIDQGIELLTGIRAGRRGTKDEYPADSINGRVLAQLRDFAAKRKAFGVTDGQNAKQGTNDGA